MQSAREALSSFTSASAVLTILLLLGFIITNVAPQTKAFLVLVPGKVSFAIWTCLTSSFIVVNPVELLIDVAVLVFVWKIVEPVYGALELFKLLALIALATGVTTFVIAYIAFVLGRFVSALYVKICGFHGLLGALLVCFKQVAPDHQLLFCDAIKIKAQWLPSIYVLCGSVIGLCYHPLNFYPFLIFGTYYAWFYLRFWQIDKETGLKGDPSPSFNFASFFPEIMRGMVNRFSSFCSSVFQVKSTRRNETLVIPVSTRNDLDEDPFEQTRRRERGQRALDARLAMTNENTAVEMPQIHAQEAEASQQ